MSRKTLLLIAVGVIGFTLGFIIGGRNYTFSCARLESNQVTCVRAVHLLGIPLGEETVSGVTGVDVAVIGSDYGNQYRVELYTNSGGVVPLTTAYSTGPRKKVETAELIDRFLLDPAQTKLEVDSGVSFIAPIVFLFLSVGFASAAVAYAERNEGFKFLLHTAGVWVLMIGALPILILALFVANRFFNLMPGDSGASFLIFLLLAAGWFGSAIVIKRLYAEYFTLPCPNPDCNESINMNKNMFGSVTYTCRHCGHSIGGK